MSFSGVDGGYCTAIAFETLADDQPGQVEPAQATQLTKPEVAVAERCSVYCVWGGIAYGGKNMQRTAFRNVRAFRADTAFNCDTAQNYPNQLVTIEDSEFENVVRGVHIGDSNCSYPHGENFKSFITRRNTFILRGLCPLASPPEPDTTGLESDEVNCEAYALKLAGSTGNSKFTENTISSAYDTGYTPPATPACQQSDPDFSNNDFYLGVKVIPYCYNDDPVLSGNTPAAANTNNTKIFPV